MAENPDQETTVAGWAVYYFPELETIGDGQYTDFVVTVIGFGPPEVLWAFADHKASNGRCAFCEFRKIIGECPGVERHALAQLDKFSDPCVFNTLQLGRFEVPANLLPGPLFVEIERQINLNSEAEFKANQHFYDC